MAIPSVSSAAPPHSGASFLSSGNPSGKTDAHRHSLVRPANHAIVAPKAATAATPTPECPATLHCVFVPAAYQQDDPNDPTKYGNYDVANRPADGMTINQIIEHDGEGDCQSIINAFQDPLFYVSAHYVVCPSENTVYQMVQTKDVAWQAGNYGANMRSIGVENEGFAASGSAYTAKMYWMNAQLVNYLIGRFHIPRDAQHIGGHQNVPPPNAFNVPLMHMDPGPFWNWQLFYGLIGVPVYTAGNPLTSKLITVAPVWPLNKQTVTGCFPDEPGQCTNTSSQPTSLVYLHTAASLASPLLNDPLLNAGTTGTDIGNNSAKAYYGQKFVAMGHQVVSNGIWYQVNYAGGTGWIFSPWCTPTVFAGNGQYATPKAGLNSIPVYGRAYPEASTYPAGFSGPSVVTLPYSIPAGQQYSVAQTDVLTQWYNGDTFNGYVDKSLDPYDHVVFTDEVPADQYVGVQYNGRQAYLKRSDVDLAG